MAFSQRYDKPLNKNQLYQLSKQFYSIQGNSHMILSDEKDQKLPLLTLIKHRSSYDKKKENSFLDRFTNPKSKMGDLTNSRQNHDNRARENSSGYESPSENEEQIDPTEGMTFIRYFAHKFREGSSLGTVLTLTMSAAIGPGMLSLAYAVSASGIIFGIAQFCFCAILGYFSLVLLTRAARSTHQYSYPSIANATYGRKFAFFVKISFFLNNWGAAIADIILMNDMMAKTFQNFLGNYVPKYMTDPSDKFWPFVLGVTIIFPLCLKRALKGLRYVLMLGFSLTIFVACIITTTALSDIQNELRQAKEIIPMGIFITLPIGFFSYTCHPNILEAYEELEFPQTSRIRRVLFRTMVVIFLLYSVIGGFGYLSFSSNPEVLISGNVLLAYPSGHIAAEIAILLFSITMTLALPLGMKPVKDCLLAILSPEEKRDSNLKHFILTFITVFSVIGVAYFVQNMSEVINLLGASTNSLICFNLPALYYVKIAKKDKGKGLRIIAAHVLNITLFLFSSFSIAYFVYNKVNGYSNNES